MHAILAQASHLHVSVKGYVAVGERALLPMALFGQWSALGGFSQLPDLLAQFNVDDAVWLALTTNLGDPGNSIGVFSAICRRAVL